jgi:DNA polymerase-3 subunit alpha
MEVAALQNLSSFSLLTSPTKITSLLKAAKKQGYQAVGLTDINVTYGLVDFYQQAQQIGIKPLLGMCIRLNGLSDSANKYDLLAYARDDQGYRNLLRLSSAINLLTDNGQNDHIVSLRDLKKYLQHLIFVLPANQHSELVNLHLSNPDQGANFLRQLAQITSDSLYLGVYPNENQHSYCSYVASLAKQLALPLVAVSDCQYLRPQDQFLQKAVLAIKSGQQLHDPLALAKQPGSHYLPAAQELSDACYQLDLASALKNTWQIAQACQAKIVFKSPQLPKYQPNKYASSQLYLQNLAQTGLAAKFKNKIPAAYQKRLDYELQVINQMGFDDYFLIVWDVVKHCRQNKITIGPGRGSACGSLVSYCLQITAVDPLKYHLLFERFLNPARHEMPDIDLDIPDNRRDDVITYMFKKYGMDHAAQILTFGTMAAKQALRDCCRIFGFSQVESNKWAQAVPFSKGKISLAAAYQQSQQLRLLTEANKENQLLFKTAQALENLPRHYSIHAAGLVISDNSIAAIAGLQAGPLGIPVTQQTKKYVEPLGLLKIDFLGLRNLTLLGNTLSLIASQGQALDPNKIPLTDQATLALFQQGKTEAIFQFESGGIRQVLRRLHPDDFEDLVAVNALYRPGPMQNIDHFIARKHGQEAVTYPAPILKPILEPTYGILVYQEQVMQTARLLAGFSLGEADILRRAMSKKKQAVIDQEKNKFIAGSVKNGYSREVASRVYQYIEQFANYGFNRSHAVAYTKIAFWLAYLKVHFPAAFYTALLNTNSANKAKLQNYIMQLQSAGVKVLPPDINRSQLDYCLDQGKILVGFKAIKGLRLDFINTIVAMSPVKSFDEFLHRLPEQFLQAAAIKNLIKAGCFDRLEANRNLLLTNCKELIDNVKLTGNNLALSASLGGAVLQEAPALTKGQQADLETEVMGFATTTTPLVAVQKYAQRFHARALADFEINDSGIAAGKLLKLKQIKTKKGATMAFASFADAGSSQEFVIFPRIYARIKDILKIGSVYLLGLKVQSDRYDSSRKQYLLTNLRLVNFKD